MNTEDESVNRGDDKPETDAKIGSAVVSEFSLNYIVAILLY